MLLSRKYQCLGRELLLRPFFTGDKTCQLPTEALGASTSPVVTRPAPLAFSDTDLTAILSVQLKSMTFSFLTVRPVPARHSMRTEAAGDVNKHVRDFLKSLLNKQKMAGDV